MKKQGKIAVKKTEDNYTRIYQFKITLKNTKSPVWRRIQVPETFTFWDLHCAITDSMGWLDYHLHQFEVYDPDCGEKIFIGIPGDDEDTILDWNRQITQYFSLDGSAIPYTYDMGDNWEHSVKLEKILPREKGVKYPRCIEGEMACPPEDCGGVWGYQDMLQIISNNKHKEYKETMQWLGGSFNPEKFDMARIKFEDPSRRMKKLVR